MNGTETEAKWTMLACPEAVVAEMVIHSQRAGAQLGLPTVGGDCWSP